MCYKSAWRLPALWVFLVAALGGAVQTTTLRGAETVVNFHDLPALVHREASRFAPAPGQRSGDRSDLSTPAEAAHLAALAALLEDAANDPQNVPGDEIGACLARLDTLGTAPEICAAVRGRYVRENLFLQIDGSLIFSQFEQDVDEPVSIRQFRDGATITGRGRLVGHVRFQVAPCSDRAALRMLFEGSMQAGLRGSAGPVGFCMHNSTRLNAEKWLWADGNGVLTRPAVAHADSSIRVNNLWSSLRGPVRNRVASRIGWRRVSASRPGSERASELQAKRELEARFNAQAEELATALEETYAEQVSAPLKKHGVYPRRLQVSSTNTHLRVAATVAADDQLAGWTPPPSGTHTASLALTMHESLVNNAADTTLSGRTILAEELANTLEPWLGRVPPEFADVGGVTWSLTLAEKHPLELRIADDDLRVVVRCQKITAGAEEFSQPLVVTAHYRGAIDGQEFALIRKGELEMFAPGLLATTRSDGLSDAQEDVRLRFEMILAEELRMSTDRFPLEPPAGTALVPTGYVARDGWVHMTIDARSVANLAHADIR